MRILWLFLFIVLCTAETTKKPSFSSKVKNKLIKGRDRFREWLKWDAECNFLTLEERLDRIREGRCPPLSSTTTSGPTTSTKESFWKRIRKRKSKKKSKVGFFEKKKQKLMSAFNSGKMNKVKIDLTPSHSAHLVIAGSMLVLTCDTENYGKNESIDVSWFVNTNRIEAALLDWRVALTEDQKLSIWPITEEDEGEFECTVGGTHHASAAIDVISRKDALVSGFVNYLIVFAVYIPFAAVAFFLIGKNATQPPIVKEKGDRMAEFLEQQILESRTAVKENLARIVHGEDFERRKAAIEESVRSGVNSLRTNKDTIMTILAPVENPPTSVVTSGKGKGNNGSPKEAQNAPAQ